MAIDPKLIEGGKVYASIHWFYRTVYDFIILNIGMLYIALYRVCHIVILPVPGSMETLLQY